MPILSARLIVLVLLAVSLLGGIGAFRISLVQEITALLPDREDRDLSLINLARHWGLMKKVVVVLGPDEPSSERLHQATDNLAKDLARLDGVGSVMSRIDQAEVRRAAEIILERSSRLYRAEQGQLDSREIEKRLRQLKDRLSMPEAMVMQQYLLQDPLGFSRGALTGLEAAGEAMGTIVDQGHLVSGDRRCALIVAEIDFSPLDVSRAGRFVVDLNRTVERSLEQTGAKGLRAIQLGGVHFSASSAKAIISDVKTAFILTFIFVVAIFLLFFKGIRMLPAALLPGAIGIAAAMGVMGLFSGELHALTLGFAATITGISMDYAIHLLHRAHAETGGTTRQRIERALGAVTRPVVLGCLTTLGAFILVATSDFTGIRQLALFAAVSIPVAMLVTLFGLPAFHGFLLGNDQGSGTVGSMRKAKMLAPGNIGTGRRLFTVSVFVVALFAGLWWSVRVPLSGNPRDLGNSDEELVRHEESLQKIFPGLTDQAFLVVSGNSIEDTLQANDALYQRLMEKGVNLKDIISISPFLPSKRTQERSLALVRELYSSGDTAELFRSAGFRDEYISGLKDKLDASPIGPEIFRDSSLGQLISDALKKDNDEHRILTRVRVSNEEELGRLEGIAASVKRCRLVSERLEIKATLFTLQKELARMLAIWLVAALVLLSLSERSVLFGLKAAAPALFGVVVAVGLFGLLGRPLTAVASAGVTLVMGLGIDYGIFMQSGSAETRGNTASAVLASALTTIAAFGVLALADTRAMADLGLIILIGVSAALLTALGLLPVLSFKRSPKGEA
ncbi:MAG: MMPL family transporter [Proteobacteria bacterium]|nr:MMPL family transporter [Pseudomonadota bacterium]